MREKGTHTHTQSRENEDRLAERIREKERRKSASSEATDTVVRAENGRLPRSQHVFRQNKKQLLV